MGFEQLQGAVDEGQALGPILQEEVRFADEETEDGVAIKLVLQDVQTAETYLLSKGIPTQLDYADDLYRAFVRSKTWPGTDTPRANLGMPVVLEAIEKILPIIHLAFFSDKKPFMLLPLGKTTPDQARAREKVLQWAIKQGGFKEGIRQCLKHTLLYGFCFGKWGWTTSKKKTKKYAIDNNGTITVTPNTIDINHPTFENAELRYVLADPTCREQDCRKAKFIISQVFITANELDSLRADPTYKNVPSREELAVILANNNEATTNSMKANKTATYRDLQAQPDDEKSSADPLAQPLELLEYVTDDKVITVLQRKILIRNDKNEFDRKNYVSCAFIDVPGSMYGFGIAKMLNGEQRFQQGVLNSWIDQLTLQLNPTFQLQKGMGAGTQQIKFSPGKVITESGELKPLASISVTREALEAINSSEVRATRRVGANGGADMPDQAMRTAEGVQAFSAGVTEKLQYFIELFADLVYIPTLEAFIEMCNDHLEPKQVQAILSEEDGKEYAGNVLDLYNCSTAVEVLTSTKLAARKATIQLVNLLLQMVSAQPVHDALTQQNKKFNFVEMLEEACDLVGWDADSLVVDMTPDDMKRAMMLNAAAAKGMADQGLQQKKHQDDLEDIQAQGEAKAGVKVVDHILKTGQGSSPDISSVLGNLTGQPPAEPQPVPPGPEPGQAPPTPVGARNGNLNP